MTSFASIDAFLAHMARVQAELPHAQRRGEEAAGKALAHLAAAMVGTEDERWAALAASTVARKERLGQTGRVSATDPLYATGEYRVSISYRIEGGAVLIGSGDPIAPFLEFGTGRMPERPVFGPTMFVHGHAAADLIAGHIMGAFMGLAHPLGDHGALLAAAGASG